MAERVRIWLERGDSGYWLRDAATGEAMRWSDERILVVPVAGASYRLEELADPAFDPGRPLALVPEPENEHDPNAIAIWDAERRLQAGYVPAPQASDVPDGAQAVSLWEFRDEAGKRVGLRVLVAPPDAWIGTPR
jgi:hypothetical protein